MCCVSWTSKTAANILQLENLAASIDIVLVDLWSYKKVHPCLIFNPVGCQATLLSRKPELRHRIKSLDIMSASPLVKLGTVSSASVMAWKTIHFFFLTVRFTLYKALGPLEVEAFMRSMDRKWKLVVNHILEQVKIVCSK